MLWCRCKCTPTIYMKMYVPTVNVPIKLLLKCWFILIVIHRDNHSDKNSCEWNTLECIIIKKNKCMLLCVCVGGGDVGFHFRLLLSVFFQNDLVLTLKCCFVLHLHVYKLILFSPCHIMFYLQFIKLS